MSWQDVLKYQRFPQLNQLISQLEMTDYSMGQETIAINKELAQAMKRYLEQEEMIFAKIKQNQG